MAYLATGSVGVGIVLIQLLSLRNATTTGCSGASYDLRSVVTHELGHVLGLDHAAENGADDLTMSPAVYNCNASGRTLGAGDLTGIYVKHRW